LDQREIKTKRAIKNAFLMLRAQKPIEKITIRELAALAEISKATFYLHYQDIYDLSEQIGKEVLTNIPDRKMYWKSPMCSQGKSQRASFLRSI